MNESKIKNKRFMLRVALWALAVLVVCLICYCIPGLFQALTPTYTAQYDTMKQSSTQECYLVKDEQIVYSDHTGTASYAYGEGSYVRKLLQVCTVNNNPYTTPQSGTVTYTVDGFEAYFVGENIPNITRAEVKSYDIERKQLGTDQVNRGDPIFKVVDDKQWFLIFWVGIDDSTHYTQGRDVEVVIDNENKIKATIDAIYEQDKDHMVVLRTNDYYPGLACTRVVNAEIVTVNETGIIIEQRSISTVDGQEGVYVRQVGGDYKFVRIKAHSIVDDKAIVANGSFTETDEDGNVKVVNTINLYDEILRNPKNKDKGGD